MIGILTDCANCGFLPYYPILAFGTNLILLKFLNDKFFFIFLKDFLFLIVGYR